MLNLLSGSLCRATIATSDKMRTGRLSWVFHFGVVHLKSSCSSVETLAGVLKLAFGCSSAPCFSRSPVTSRDSVSQAIVSCLNLSHCNDFLNKFSSRKGWHLKRDLAPSPPYEPRWILSSSIKQSMSGFCGFATAAIHFKEPGKYWRGKGWNRVGQKDNRAVELVGNQTGPTTASQFDAIPDVEEKLKFLKTCGLGDSQLEMMRKRSPSAVKNTCFKLSVKKLIEVATFLEKEVGIARKDFGNLYFANPYIAGSRVDECLRPKIKFLRNRGISKEQLGKMVLRSPQLLTLSLEGKLLTIDRKLQDVGVKVDEIGKIFIKHPGIFGTRIIKFDENVQSLRDGGITDVPKAIFQFPQVMGLSLDTKFQQIMQCLRDELKLKQEEITKMIACQISMLSLSVEENIRPKIVFFSEMGLQKEDIARLVVKYPFLFGRSLDNSIKPKVEYLVKVMNLEALELLTFPHYLSYSLQSRIIPRHEFVVKHRLNYRLSSLLSCSEDVFQKRYRNPAYSELVEPTVQSV